MPLAVSIDSDIEVLVEKKVTKWIQVELRLSFYSHTWHCLMIYQLSLLDLQILCEKIFITLTTTSSSTDSLITNLHRSQILQGQLGNLGLLYKIWLLARRIFSRKWWCYSAPLASVLNLKDAWSGGVNIAKPTKFDSGKLVFLRMEGETMRLYTTWLLKLYSSCQAELVLFEILTIFSW